MLVTHDNGESESSGHAVSYAGIRLMAAEPGRVDAVEGEVLGEALRRADAERREPHVTGARFDNRL